MLEVSPIPNPPLPAPQREDSPFLDIIGDLVEQWGFNRHTGRIWALLYLHAEPLTPKQIQQDLALSAGSVNALLSELQTWGAIRRIRIPGDRNFYFEPQTAVWKSVANVLQSRELRILAEARTGMEALTENLKKSPKSEERDLQLSRLERISSLLGVAASIGNLLVNAPVERLEKLSQFIRKLRNL